MSDGGNMGFASVHNTQNFTTESLFEKLAAIKVSFGTPELGAIGKTPAAMYRNVTKSYDVFARVHKKNVIMGKIASQNSSSLEAGLGLGLSLLLTNHNEAEDSTADRAVDELLEVIKKLENGEAVTESTASQPARTATGKAIELFMEQKALSLTPKFDIYDERQVPVYHVEGDLPRLNFSIQKDGVEVLTLKKKLVAIMPEYTLLKNKKEIGKLKKKFKLTKPEVNGQVNDKELKIAGDIVGFDFNILYGGNDIGHVDTARTFWSDCYRIQILDERLQDLLIALAIICDNVSDQENK